MGKAKRLSAMLLLVAGVLSGLPLCAAAQEAPAATSLTLKHAVDLALQNSPDIRVARLQASLADRAADFTRAQFLPNLYAGSGVGYTFGIPETPGGRAPSVFSVTYTEQVLNEPLRGQAREQQEQARAQRIALEQVKDAVIARTASAYLELVKVRHSLELLHAEEQSAAKILDVTSERQSAGYELPIEVTKAQLTKAQIAERLLELEGREDQLAVFLRAQAGLAPDTPIELAPDPLPGAADQEGATLVAMATEDSPEVRLAESDVRAKEFRLTGEKRGHWPTLELVSVYSRLARFNNYKDFFKSFQANNYNAGIQLQVPIFSAATKAAVALASANLKTAQESLAARKIQVSADVRQKSRRVRQMDAAKEVARLELQLAQQNLAVVQAQLDEGKASLRDAEKSRLDENEKWMAYLDADFQRQQAQLDLLRAAGQLAKVWQ